MNWHKYPDTMPDDDGKYLVVLANFDFQTAAVVSFTKNLRQIDKYNFSHDRRPGWYSLDSEYGYFERSNVTHWMELPQMPNNNIKE